MTIYCIRTRRPGEHSWQFVAPQHVITDQRHAAMTWDTEFLAKRYVPYFARQWPDREFRVSPITAYIV